MIKELLEQLAPLDAQIAALRGGEQDEESPMAAITAHASELAELAVEEDEILRCCGPLTACLLYTSQAGPLLDDGVDRRTVHALGVVGVAVFIVQLEDAQPGRAVPGEIHHGQVRPGDGGVGVHVIEQRCV